MSAIMTSTKSEYYCVPTGWGPLHIHICHEDGNPTKVFTQIPPIGSDWHSMTALIGILLTKYLEAGGDINRIVKHLRSIHSDKVTYWNDKMITSIPNAIATALDLYLQSAKPDVENAS